MSVLRVMLRGPMGGEVKCYPIDQAVVEVTRPKACVEADADAPVELERGEYHLNAKAAAFIWQGWKK